MIRTLYLVAESRFLNPTLSAEQEAEDYRLDPQSAIADWGCGWRSDESQAFADADIDVATLVGQYVVPSARHHCYVAYADLSGGRHDSAALAIAHKDKRRVIVDRVEVVPSPHDPKKVIARFAEVCREYFVDSISADNYGGEIMVPEFRANGIALIESEFSSASDIYCQAMPLFTARILDLPDVARLTHELRQLERHPRNRGGDQIRHPRKGMDDVANAALGAAVKASRLPGSTALAHYQPSRPGLHVSGTAYDPFASPDEPNSRESMRGSGANGCISADGWVTDGWGHRTRIENFQ